MIGNTLSISGAQADSQVSVYTTDGRLVFESVLEGNSLDVTVLTRGLYLFRIEDEATIVTGKFVR